MMEPIPSCPEYFACWGGHIWRNGRQLKEGTNGRGYLKIRVRGLDRYVHRLVCEAYHGACPDGLECRHLDGDRANNSPVNLKWSTKAENEADKKRHGTLNCGERQGHAILTDDVVLEARRRVAAGEPIQDVADSLGHRRATIGDAVFGRRWNHLPGALPPYSTRRKFNEQQIREIRHLLGTMPTRDLGRRYGVTEGAIRAIAKRQTYQHVA